MDSTFNKSLKEGIEILFRCLLLNQPYIKAKGRTVKTSLKKSSWC